jgi:hypothetical protein
VRAVRQARDVIDEIAAEGVADIVVGVPVVAFEVGTGL